MRLTTSRTETSKPGALGEQEDAYRIQPPARQATPTTGTPERPGLKRRLKDRARRGLRQMFEAGQRLGIDVLPRHFYSQVPDIRALRADRTWSQPRSMVGVQGIEPSEQFDFVETCCSAEVVAPLRGRDVYAWACETNGEPGFGLPDAEFLYGFIRTIRPRRIVQVGCGVSTAVILHAAQDTAYRPEIVCVEPYPTEFLERSARDGRITLVRQRAQDVPQEVLTDLGDEGFLFVDSTHTVKPGSEVNRLILEILPRLAAGDWVHFHDIYFPYDYQRGLIDDELFFSNESVLLHALLINNPALAVRASLSMLHYTDPGRLAPIAARLPPGPRRRRPPRRPGTFPGLGVSAGLRRLRLVPAPLASPGAASARRRL